MKEHDWKHVRTWKGEGNPAKARHPSWTTCWECEDCGRRALATAVPTETLTTPLPSAGELQAQNVEPDCHLETVGQVHDL